MSARPPLPPAPGSCTLTLGQIWGNIVVVEVTSHPKVTGPNPAHRFVGRPGRWVWTPEVLVCGSGFRKRMVVPSTFRQKQNFVLQMLPEP